MEARAYVQEKDLVDQVNEALEELRMNKAELALRMSVSRSMMSQYLNRTYGNGTGRECRRNGRGGAPPAKDGLL